MPFVPGGHFHLQDHLQHLHHLVTVPQSQFEGIFVGYALVGLSVELFGVLLEFVKGFLQGIVLYLEVAVRFVQVMVAHLELLVTFVAKGNTAVG